MKKYIIASLLLIGCDSSGQNSAGISSSNSGALELTSTAPFEMYIDWYEDEGCDLLTKSNPIESTYFGTAYYYVTELESNTLGEAVSIQFEAPSKSFFVDNLEIDDIDMSAFEMEYLEGGDNEIIIPHTVTIDGEQYDAKLQIMGTFGWWTDSFYYDVGTGSVFNSNYRYIISLESGTCAVNGAGLMELKK